MTSFKRFGSKPVVKYAYIGISADRQRHNLLWLLYKNKYRICPIIIEIIHGALTIYWFYHGLALCADILPLDIARGKIFGIKGQPVVKPVYIQDPMNYFLIIQCIICLLVAFGWNNICNFCMEFEYAGFFLCRHCYPYRILKPKQKWTTLKFLHLNSLGVLENVLRKN